MRRYAPGLAALLVPAAVIGGFFLGIYLLDGYRMPIGFDTARYLSETEMVAAFGLGGVESLTPPPSMVLASRVGFPVVVLGLSSILSTSTFAVAAVIPAIAAVGVGLAAGALASRVLDRGPWTLCVVALATGVSPAVVRLAAPEAYTDNLLAAAVIMAALVLVVGRGVGPVRSAGAAVLLAAGGLFHTYSFLLTSGVLLLAAAWLAPRSRRRRRAGTPALATPSGRIAAAVAGAAALWALVLYGAVGTGPDEFRISVEILRQKLVEDLPVYRFPLTLPLAAAGAAALALRGRPRPPEGSRELRSEEHPARLTLILVGAWAAVTVAAGSLLFLGVVSPAHRLLAFFLPLPLLVGVGLLAIGDRVARLVVRAVGVGVVVAGVAGLLLLSVRTYYGTFPTERGVRWLEADRVREADAAARYLRQAGVAPGRPVVFVVDDAAPEPSSFFPLMAYVIRSALPAERYEHLYLYVGEPRAFLEGRPTLRDAPPYDRIAGVFFRAVRPVMDRDPVVILASAFNPAYAEVAEERPESVVAPGVVALRGPRPAAPLSASAPPAAPGGVLGVGGLGAGSLAVVVAAGLGWAIALRPRAAGWMEVAALAPAAGVAALVLAGVAADAAGVSLTGVQGAMVPAAAMTLGGAAAVLRLRADRRGQPGTAGDPHR